MKSRRELLLLTAGAAGLAGCSGDEGGGTTNPPTEVATSTDTPQQTETDTPTDTEITTEETTEVPEDLTGEEIYFDWINGENGEILEEAREEISFEKINQAMEEGGTRVQQVANAAEHVATQYTEGDEDNDFVNRHRHIMSAVHQTLEQREENYEVYSIADAGMSDQFPESGSFGLEYGKIWVENEDGGYEDINLSLDPQYVATHIEGTEPETDIEEALQEQRNPDRSLDRPAHDYEALQEAIEFYEANGQDYDEEDLESGHAHLIENFDHYIWGDGMAVPSSTEDWEQLHKGFESGPDILKSLNEAYHNSEYAENGETAQFSIEDGSVSMEDTPDEYDPSTDGIINNPAA